MNISNIILTSETSMWSLQIALIMSTCNILSIIIGRYAINVRGLGPSIPLSSLKGLGLPELLATTSLGHMIGAGTILGLRQIGILM